MGLCVGVIELGFVGKDDRNGAGVGGILWRVPVSFTACILARHARKRSGYVTTSGACVCR